MTTYTPYLDTPEFDAWADMLRDCANQYRRAMPLPQPLGPRPLSQQEEVYEYIAKHPGCWRDAIADATHIHRWTVSTAITRLHDKHRIRREVVGRYRRLYAIPGKE